VKNLRGSLDLICKLFISRCIFCIVTGNNLERAQFGLWKAKSSPSHSISGYAFKQCCNHVEPDLGTESKTKFEYEYSNIKKSNLFILIIYSLKLKYLNCSKIFLVLNLRRMNIEKFYFENKSKFCKKSSSFLRNESFLIQQINNWYTSLEKAWSNLYIYFQVVQ